MAFNWTCPYCNAAQAVGSDRYSIATTPFKMDGNAEGDLALQREVTICANSDCKRTTIHIQIGNYKVFQTTNFGVRYELTGQLIFDDTVAPRSAAKPQPAYIPRALRQDYEEACLIANLSPKASATLTRRCLQGMIRDFADISRKRLVDEIDELKTAVEDGTADRAITPETVAAIDHVRSVGNIGAHMEADIDHIVSVDPGEAKAMIELVEMLFDEWYGARHRRTERLATIERIRSEKDEIKRAAKDMAVRPAADGVAPTAADTLG